MNVAFQIDIGIVRTLAGGMTIYAGPIEIPVVAQLVRTLEGRAENALQRAAGTGLIGFGIVAQLGVVIERKVGYGHFAHLVGSTADVGVVPLNLVSVGRYEVEFGMSAPLLQLLGIFTLALVGNVHRALHLTHGVGIEQAVGGTVHVLITAGQHQAQTVVQEAASAGQAQPKVGQRAGIRQLRGSFRKVTHRSLVVSPMSLARCRHGDVVAHRSQIAVKINGVVTYGGISLNAQRGGCILHHHIDNTTGSIALHVGGKRLGDLQAVHQFTGKKVERHVTFLVVGAGNLNAVYQRVVVALVHTAQHGVLALAGTTLVHHHSRHALNYSSHVNIRRKTDGLCAHYIHDAQRFHFKLAGTQIGVLTAVGAYGNGTQVNAFRFQLYDGRYRLGRRNHDLP